MNIRSHGFGTIQLVIAVAVIAAISFVAPPQYRSFMARAQVTEVFSVAGESKQRLSEFYSVNTRLPQTVDEAEFARPIRQPLPGIVRDLIVEPRPQSGEVIVKILLKDGMVDNPGDGDQFIFIAGAAEIGSGHSVTWTCGARGIDNVLLPEECRG